MDAWDKYLGNSIADAKSAKRDSREHEIFVLENADNADLVREVLECEREYREFLDNDIAHYKEWLMERKELDR